VAEIAIPKVWRSETRLLLLYIITSCLSVYLSYLIPWTIIVGELFVVGGVRVILHLPLLWFVPIGFLATAVFRLYDVHYMIDTDGIEAKIGLLNFRKRTVRVRFEDIRSVKTHQDLIGRLFDIGRIEIRTAATSDLEIFLEGVSAPLEIHSMIESEKAQRQQLTARMTKDSSSKFSKRGKVAVIFLLMNSIGVPWNTANATPEKDKALEIKSIPDGEKVDVQKNEQAGRSLRESVIKSTLEGDADRNDRQNRLLDEEKLLRNAEKELLKGETKPSEKIKPAPSKKISPRPESTQSAPPPTAMPSPRPTVAKDSGSNPKSPPKKDEPKAIEVKNKSDKVIPSPAALAVATSKPKSTTEKSIPDVQKIDVQKNEQAGRSLRESVVKSTLEGASDQNNRQNKLLEEEKLLRNAEKELLKSENKPSEKIKPASSKEIASRPESTPKKEEPKAIEVKNKSEEVIPSPAALAVDTSKPKSPTDTRPAIPGGEILRLSSENARLRNEIEALKLKAKTELKEVDDLRVTLMVAETQVERLNKIIEECSERGDRNFSYKSGAQEITPHDGTSHSMYATVIGNSITPRTGPGNSFAPISSLRRGQRVPVENRQGDWYKVRLPSGAFAWVHSALIKIGGSDDTFNLPGTVPPSARDQASSMGKRNKPVEDTTPAHEERLDDVDKEAFKLLEQLKMERDSESGS
jgi:hypothetical protein